MSKIIDALKKAAKVANPVTGAKAMYGDIKTQLGKARDNWKKKTPGFNEDLYLENLRKIKKNQGLEPPEVEAAINKAKEHLKRGKK